MSDNGTAFPLSDNYQTIREASSQMTIQLLEEIQAGRKAAQLQEEQYKSGQRKESPSVTPKTFDLMEKVVLNMNGDYSKGKASLRETITTNDTVKLIPKIIEGKLREAAEPTYLGTNFMQTVNVDSGNTAVYVIPVAGELNAYEVGEGSPIPESNMDYNTLESSNLEIRVRKYGVKVSITEEAINDSSWDILSLHTRKMGQAMARLKEEQIFSEFSRKGHTVYDNAYRDQQPALGTTGRGADGMFNDTLSVEDFLDMVLALMGNGFVPTDVIMHPLTWVVFARNSMIGNGLTFGALGGNNVSPWGTIQGTNAPFGLQNNGNGQKLIMTPEQTQNRLPVPLTMNFSPFVRFDKQNKLFDMYCLDRNEVGVIAQREKLSLDNWSDPERDIRMLKCKERYGIGIMNNGRAIATIKNIAVASTYPVAPEVSVTTK